MPLQVFNPHDAATATTITADDREQASALLNAYVKQTKAEFDELFSQIRPKDYAAGQAIFDASPTQQTAVAIAAITLLAKTVCADPQRDWALRALLTSLFRRSLPFDEQSLVQLLTVADKCITWELPVGSVIGAVARHANQNVLTAAVRSKLEKLQGKYNSDAIHSDWRKIGERIEEILGDTGDTNPSIAFDFNTSEAWTNALTVELGHLEDNARTDWQRFLEHCATAKSSKPSKKWLKGAAELLGPIGEEQFADVICPTLAAIGQPGKVQKHNLGGYTHYSDPTEIHDTHAEMLRGLVWSTQLFDNEILISAIGDAAENCFKKVPNVGPRSPKIGNACLNSLSSMSSLSAIAQLGRIKARAKHASTRKQIARALERAAANAGMTETDLEELAVPTLGLTEIGHYTEAFGEFTAEMIVTPHGKPELAWIKENGKQQKTVPAAVKTDFSDQLKTLKKKTKDITTLMPSLRHRVEQLFFNERRWSLVEFRKRFLDHPLMGVICRRLIWNFESKTQSESAFWTDDNFVDFNGKSVDWIDDETTVMIWHPMQLDADNVLSWREWLEKQEIVQPFKQAHREIYILTNAERETQTYSNRFAAQFIKQHQLLALCESRGWRYRLQGDWDSSNAPTLELPQHDLRVEFRVEPIEGSELSEAMIYVYLSTDQVRFSRLDSYAPLPLEQIPPRIFSEVMRDVDLFVGVASVGNDPNWADGGTVAFGDGWQEFAFGDLSQTAKTRLDVLQRVVPRLKIADQCSFTNKFLIVEGKLRTYKIHLGSGNVLMLPNDQYLCIVPKRGGSTKQTGNIYLPFEGDNMLSVILSKAFLLADDDKIKDESIKHQIGKS